LRRELGLSLASFASLAKDIGLVYRQQADAIEQLGEQGREIVERRRAAMRAAGWDGGGDAA
jgi:hypothetical protein